jgi:hypothetical protein
MHSFQQRFLAILAADPLVKSYVHAHVRRTKYGVQLVRSHFADLRFNSNPSRAYQALASAVQNNSVVKTRDIGSAITLAARLHALTSQVYGITGDRHSFHVRPHLGPVNEPGIWVDSSGPHSNAMARSGKLLRFELGHIATSRIELAWPGSPPQTQRHPFAVWVDRVLQEGTNDSDPKSMVVAELFECLRRTLQGHFDLMLLNRRRELGFLPWPDGSVLATKQQEKQDKPFVFDPSAHPRVESTIYLSRNQLLHGYGGRKGDRAMDYATMVRLPDLLPKGVWQDPTNSCPTVLVRVDGPRDSAATLIIEPNREIRGKGKRLLTEIVTGSLVRPPGRR